MVKRLIPSTAEELPVVGLGTWATFDVADNRATQDQERVLEVMHRAGGRLIDSSPMYGNAEKIVGDLTADLKRNNDFFYATKVWTTGKEEGIRQMEASLKKMKRRTMDLMQIHNLTDWKTHLSTLRDWKASGRIRYIGITHYTDAMHPELERIISTEQIDFVQFNYSLFSRNAENSLLPLAADKGVATIINRPFGTGNAFIKVKNKQLPVFAREHSIETWSQFFLLYIISHPAVTSVIPATSNPTHAAENYNLPDITDTKQLREKMLEYIQTLSV